MAQAGFTPISLFHSTTAAAVPTSGNLVAGELALNTVDEKLYFKNSAGTVKLLASNATSAPVLSFSAGTTGLTPNTATTGAVTLAGTLAVANGGTGVTTSTGTTNVVLSNNPVLVGPTLGVATATSLQGIIGNVTPAAGSFTTVTASTAIGTASGGTGLGGATPFTANGVVFASSASALSTGSALTFDGTNLILGSASPAFQGSSSIGSVTLINNSGGAYVRAYGGSHATRANFTEFANGSTTSFISSAGNFGLAVTPSIFTVGKAIEVASVGNAVFGVGAADMRIVAGAYYDSAWKYAVTGSAVTKYEQTTGVHSWFNAPSGTAGNNATFTQAMTLDASGNLGIGTTSPAANLHISKSGGSSLMLSNPSTSLVTDDGMGNLDFTAGTSNTTNARVSGLVIGTSEAGGSLSFETRADGGSLSEKLRITGAGNLGIGTSSPAAKIDVNGSAIISGTLGIGTSTFATNSKFAVQTSTCKLDIVPDGASSIKLLAGTGGMTLDAPSGLFFDVGSTQQFEARNLQLYSSGTIKATTSISVGNATPTTSGAGITFPATQSASSDANTLDDYEEGDWTATFVPNTSGTITLSSATGTYTKVGRVVTISGNFIVLSVSSPTGYLKIAGLPFAGGGPAKFRCGIAIDGTNMNATMTTVLTATVQGDTNIYVLKPDGAGGQSLTTAADMKATTQIFIGGTYTID